MSFVAVFGLAYILTMVRHAGSVVPARHPRLEPRNAESVASGV